MRLVVFVFSLFLIGSCMNKPSKDSHVKSTLSVLESAQKNLFCSDSLLVNALDLSEDMSRLSTKNDEVIFLLYQYSDSNTLQAPLVSVKKVFDKANSNYQFALPKKDKLILFVIEEDSFRNIEQIEPVVRIYFKEIRACKGYNDLKKYLGEDDLLGIKIIDNSINSFTLNGVNSLDKFSYSFERK